MAKKKVEDIATTKILLRLQKVTVEQLDRIAEVEERKRSDLMREAIRLYIRDYVHAGPRR